MVDISNFYRKQPVAAFGGTSCDQCLDEVEEGDDLFLTDDGRLCSRCYEDLIQENA